MRENKSARKFSKYRFSKFDYLMFIIRTIYDAFYIPWVGVRENKSARKLSKFKVRENKSARKFSNFAQPECAKIITRKNLYKWCPCLVQKGIFIITLRVESFTGRNFRGDKLSRTQMVKIKFRGYKLSRTSQILVKFSYFDAIFSDFSWNISRTPMKVRFRGYKLSRTP